MTLAPDNRAWNVTCRKGPDGIWYASFMFVDMEFDGFMVDMYLNYDKKIQVNFKSSGSEYVLLDEVLMESFHECVDLAKFLLLELEEDDE